ISASWAAHPDLVRVRVCRRAGRAPRDSDDGTPVPSGKTSFVDTAIREGSEYFYGLTAVYHDDRHAEVDAPMVVVVSAPVEQSRIEPVGQPQARRTGGEAVLTWVWPADVHLAEVRWTTPDGTVDTRRITKARYRDRAGCTIPVGTGGGVAEVRAMVMTPTGATFSPPVSLRVPGRPVAVRYTVRKPGRLSRRRVVEL